MYKQYDKMIIDGNNFLFRAFHTKRPEKIINEINATAVHQFMYMLKSVVSKFKPKEVYMAWDKKLNPIKENYRKGLVAYKEQRVENETSKKMFATIPVIQEYLDALGINTLYPVNMEGDDVIRFLAINDLKTTIIVSSDNDLLQLINDDVHVYLPLKDIVVWQENFEEVVSVKPEHYMLYKAILGDKSDNVFGLEGYGPVKSKQLAEALSINAESDALTNEQGDIIARNLCVMDLSQTEKIMPEEYAAYREQAKNWNNKFDERKLRVLFETYEQNVFTREFGNWNLLFNPNYADTDLLSQICM
jgi:DNA polymerase-1